MRIASDITGDRKDHITPYVAIVDDEEDTITLMEKSLRKHNIPIAYVAFNGVEAVDRFRSAERKPDVIIMDQRMPMANGIVAMRQILAVAPGVKVLFLSADPCVRRDALEAGAAGFMVKPTPMSKIISAIYAAM